METSIAPPLLPLMLGLGFLLAWTLGWLLSTTYRVASDSIIIRKFWIERHRLDWGDVKSLRITDFGGDFLTVFLNPRRLLDRMRIRNPFNDWLVVEMKNGRTYILTPNEEQLEEIRTVVPDLFKKD